MKKSYRGLIALVNGKKLGVVYVKHLHPPSMTPNLNTPLPYNIPNSRNTFLTASTNLNIKKTLNTIPTYPHTKDS